MSSSLPLADSNSLNNNQDIDLPPLPKRVTLLDPQEDEFNDEIQHNTKESTDEENTNEPIMDPDHPLLERVQRAIKDQLTAHLESLELDLRVKQEGADREIKRREEAGVQLYNLQQHLAKIQADYEANEENFGAIKSLRADAERVLVLAKKEYEAEAERVATHSKNLELHQTEMERIQNTLRQVELYKEELRSKILVAKRTTLKTEKDLAKQEIEKKRQDYFIDKLGDQLKKLQKQKSVYDSQLEIQQKETKAALKTLREAATEMEAIQFEKRQLLNQWNTSLFGLKKRDEMIASIQKEIANNEQQLGLMANETSGLRKSMNAAVAEGESLAAVLKKLENEIDQVTAQMESRQVDKEKLAETFEILEKTMAQTEHDLSVAIKEESKIRLEINSVRKLESQTATKIQSLDQQLYEKLQQNSAFEMGASSTSRDNNKLRAQNEEKQGEISNIQNEISSVTLNTAEVSNRVENLKAELAKIDKSITDKNLEIQNYEQDFKNISDQIKKKASQMDLLNKRLGSLTSEQVHNGPLEATIASLTKSISDMDKEQLSLQTRYLHLQTELVTSTRKCQSLSSEIDTLNLLKSSLVRQNRINSSCLATEESEIAMHNRNINSLQHDLQRLSTLIHSQGQARLNLDSETLILKSNLIDKLKQAELTFIQLQSSLDKLKSDKTQILDSIIDSDREYLNWSSKLTVLKELADTLDPNTGSSELNQMSQEIYRMGLRYKSILALQERMVKEMEKGVYRRTEISKRGGKARSDGLKREIEVVKGKIKSDNAELGKYFDELVKNEEELKMEIENAKSSILEYNAKAEVLGSEVETLSARKRMFTSATLIYQKLTKRYRDLLDGKPSINSKTEEEQQIDFQDAQMRKEKISDVIRNLSESSDISSLKSALHEYKIFLQETVAVL